MKLWSKGLGTKTLVLNLREGVPNVASDGLMIKGTIKEPVWWDYTITMTDQDLIDILEVAVNEETVAYLQTVDRPWKVLGTLAAAMARFLVFWMKARTGICWRRVFRRWAARTEEKAKEGS